MRAFELTKDDSKDLTISQHEPGRQRPYSVPCNHISKKRVQPSTNHKLKALYEYDIYCNYNSANLVQYYTHVMLGNECIDIRSDLYSTHYSRKRLIC